MAHIGNAPFGKTVRTVTSETLTSVKTAYYPTGGYIVGYVDVYVNGVRLTETADFTATDGTTVTLQYNPSIGDTVDVVTYGSIELANAVRRDGDTLVGTLYTRALVPTANITYDIGTSTMRYKDLYLSGNTINLGDIKLSTNGTAFSVANTTGGTFPSALANTTITGTLTANATTITGNVSVTGNTTLIGTLAANTTTITGNVSVTGNTTLTGAQFVNGAVTFANSTSNNIFFNTDGTVSLGTANNVSSRKFQVVGQSAAISANGYIVVELDADPGANLGYIGTKSNTAVSIKTNDTNRIYIGTNGYVGIGNNAPGTKMHVAGSLTLDNNQAIRTGDGAAWMIGSTNTEITIGSQAAGQGRAIGLYSSSNSTPAIYCSTSGIVTKPKVPAFSAYVNSSVTSNGGTIPFNALRYDSGGNFNTSTYAFTAPVAGKYLFTTYDNFTGTSGSGQWIYFAVNGSVASAYMYAVAPSSWFLLGGSAVLSLSQNDSVTVVYAGASLHPDYGSSAWGLFSGILIG